MKLHCFKKNWFSFPISISGHINANLNVPPPLLPLYIPFLKIVEKLLLIFFCPSFFFISSLPILALKQQNHNTPQSFIQIKHTIFQILFSLPQSLYIVTSSQRKTKNASHEKSLGKAGLMNPNADSPEGRAPRFSSPLPGQVKQRALIRSLQPAARRNPTSISIPYKNLTGQEEKHLKYANHCVQR